MTSIIGDIFSSTTDSPADPTIARTLVSGASSSAAAYLTATLEATTPEVRRLFADYLTQTLVGQQALSDLAVKQGWVRPDDSPVRQLDWSFDHSQSVAGEDAH